MALIDEVGIEAFTMRELARRLGVSHAAPYRHYPDKRALLTALAVEAGHLLAERLERALAEAGEDRRARFLAAAYAYVRFSLDEPAYFKTLFLSSELDAEAPAMVEARQRTLGLLYGYIADAQLEGYFRQGDPNAWAAAVWAMHQGLAVLAGTGALGKLGFGDVRAVSDIVHGALLDGLVADPRRS